MRESVGPSSPAYPSLKGRLLRDTRCDTMRRTRARRIMYQRAWNLARVAGLRADVRELQHNASEAHPHDEREEQPVPESGVRRHENGVHDHHGNESDVAIVMNRMPAIPHVLEPLPVALRRENRLNHVQNDVQLGDQKQESCNCTESYPDVGSCWNRHGLSSFLADFHRR